MNCEACEVDCVRQVELFRSGQVGPSFEALQRQYSQYVLTQARKYLHRYAEQDREDCAQVVWIHLFTNLLNHDRSSVVCHFVHVLINNATFNFFARLRRRDFWTRDAVPVDGGGRFASREGQGSIDLSRVKEVIAGFSDLERSLILHRLEGKTVKATAEAYGVGLSTAYRVLKELRTKMAAALDGHDFWGTGPGPDP
jgi:RNA polymerase sigma factor (sigma-70 family)